MSTFAFSGITAKAGTLPEAVKLSNCKELDDKIDSIMELQGNGYSSDYDEYDDEYDEESEGEFPLYVF